MSSSQMRAALQLMLEVRNTQVLLFLLGSDYRSCRPFITAASYNSRHAVPPSDDNLLIAIKSRVCSRPDGVVVLLDIDICISIEVYNTASSCVHVKNIHTACIALHPRCVRHVLFLLWLIRYAALFTLALSCHILCRYTAYIPRWVQYLGLKKHIHFKWVQNCGGHQSRCVSNRRPGPWYYSVYVSTLRPLWTVWAIAMHAYGTLHTSLWEMGIQWILLIWESPHLP